MMLSRGKSTIQKWSIISKWRNIRIILILSSLISRSLGIDRYCRSAVEIIIRFSSSLGHWEDRSHPVKCLDLGKMQLDKFSVMKGNR